MSSTPKTPGFFHLLRRRFEEARILQAAGSLTFTTLLALVPLLTVMLVVFTAFPAFNGASEEFGKFINQMLVPEGASVISAHLQEFKNQAGGLTAAGIAVMAASALMLMQTIENTFDNIWQVRRRRSLTTRFTMYWALLTLVPVLIGAGISVSEHLLGWLPETVRQGHFSLWLTLLLDVVLLLGLYCFMPNVRVPLTHALPGALAAGLLLELAKWGFNIYVQHFNNYHLIYGTFAAVPLFLIWLHLLWVLVLGGAALTASLSAWQSGAANAHHGSNHRFDAAVQILMLLKSAQMDGKSLSLKSFQKRINLSGSELESLLAQLAQSDYIGTGNGNWLLKTAPEQIILKELFEKLVYEPALDGGDVPRALKQLLQPGLETLEMNLVQFEHRLVETPVVAETADAAPPAST